MRYSTTRELDRIEAMTDAEIERVKAIGKTSRKAAKMVAKKLKKLEILKGNIEDERESIADALEAYGFTKEKN